jgi:hypothetical protein
MTFRLIFAFAQRPIGDVVVVSCTDVCSFSCSCGSEGTFRMDFLYIGGAGDSVIPNISKSAFSCCSASSRSFCCCFDMDGGTAVVEVDVLDLGDKDRGR